MNSLRKLSEGFEDGYCETDRAETEHTCAKLVTLSPLSSLQQIPKLGNTWFFFLGPWILDSSFQKAHPSKHFLISDWSMTSFYAVSDLSAKRGICYMLYIVVSHQKHDAAFTLHNLCKRLNARADLRHTNPLLECSKCKSDANANQQSSWGYIERKPKIFRVVLEINPIFWNQQKVLKNNLQSQP